MNAGHYLSKEWTDGSTEATLPGPSGYMIVCHAGTVDGFINNILLVYHSKRFTIKKWIKICSKTGFKCGCFQMWIWTVVLLWTMPYCTVKMDKAPIIASQREHIISQLELHGMTPDLSLTKGALLAQVEENILHKNTS